MKQLDVTPRIVERPDRSWVSRLPVIGAGAHQHYWDQSAPDIAEKLDLLISQ